MGPMIHRLAAILLWISLPAAIIVSAAYIRHVYVQIDKWGATPVDILLPVPSLLSNAVAEVVMGISLTDHLGLPPTSSPTAVPPRVVPPPYPYLNLGLPKSGSTSLHHYFECGGVRSSHMFPCGGVKGKGVGDCGQCMFDAVKRGVPVLDWCGYPSLRDAFTQLDHPSARNGFVCYFPQVELLDRFHAEAPNATFVLPLRNVTSWSHSVSNWFAMKNRLVRCNMTGLPHGVGNRSGELEEWYVGHTNRVRDFVARHPSHTLVEFDVSSEHAGSILELSFGINSSCWGRSNEYGAFVSAWKAEMEINKKRRQKERRQKERRKKRYEK